MTAMTKAGSGVGAAFSPLGGVIGGAIGFFACIFFCKDSEPEKISKS